MIDMMWLVDSSWTKQVKTVEWFMSTGRYSGGQWFAKCKFEDFPDMVLGDFALDKAWVDLGHPVYLTPDGKAWRPRPERPQNVDWLVGTFVDMRLEFREFTTKWRGEKQYLTPRFLRINKELTG
jgi:hypothetical protein